MNGGDREMTGDPSEEAAWQDLVAQYATPAAKDGTPAPWPTREDLPGPGAPGQEEAGPDGNGQDTADLDITGLDMAGPDDPGADAAQPSGPPQIRIVRPASPAPLPGDDDDHFVPPVPPPMPRLDPITKGAWLALFGGPAYLLIAVMLSWQVPSVAAFIAAAGHPCARPASRSHRQRQPPR